MWEFYWPVVKAMPKTLFKIAHKIELAIFVLCLAIALVSPDYARTVHHWDAFDPRWATVVVILIFLHVCLIAIYEHHLELLKAQAPLTIKSAQYGANNAFVDVTAAVQRRVRNGRIHLKVDNDPLVGPKPENDPCKGVRKTLVVKYAINVTEDASVTVLERDVLSLP